DDLLEKDRLGAGDVHDGLAGHRVWQETDEVAGVTGLEYDADLAVGLEAADAGTVPGPRIDDNEWAARWVDLNFLGRNYARENIVDRTGQLSAIDDELYLKVENMRRGL